MNLRCVLFGPLLVLASSTACAHKNPSVYHELKVSKSSLRPEMREVNDSDEMFAYELEDSYASRDAAYSAGTEEPAYEDDAASPPAPGAQQGAQAPVLAQQPQYHDLASTPEPDESRRPTQEPQSDHHQVIYTASMTVEVFELGKALSDAEELPETFGGYVSMMSNQEIVLRIPAGNLRPAMAAVATYGEVSQRNLQAQDVTAEFVDVESRIRALEETQKQLLDLLKQARSVDDALHVRASLDQVNAELEVLKGRMRQLSNLIAFSTLTVQFSQRDIYAPPQASNDPFPWVNNLGVEMTEWQ